MIAVNSHLTRLTPWSAGDKGFAANGRLGIGIRNGTPRQSLGASNDAMVTTPADTCRRSTSGSDARVYFGCGKNDFAVVSIARGLKMLGVAILSNFSCRECGCVTVILPAELTDSATVRCGGCGVEYGCWAQFKDDAKQIVSAAPPGLNGSDRGDPERAAEIFQGRRSRRP